MHWLFTSAGVCLFLLVLDVNTSPIGDYSKRQMVAKGVHEARWNSFLTQVNKKSAVRPVGEAKEKLYPASKDVMIKVASAVELQEPVQQPLPIDASVRCDAAKISGWLHCEDPTGETERSEAEQICEAHNQKLWMYSSKKSYQPFSYWICSKPKSSELNWQ